MAQTYKKLLTKLSGNWPAVAGSDYTTTISTTLFNAVFGVSDGLMVDEATSSTASSSVQLGSAQNFTVLVQLKKLRRYSTQAGTRGPGIFARATTKNASNFPTNGYFVRLANDVGGSFYRNLYLDKFTAGVQSNIAQAVALTSRSESEQYQNYIWLKAQFTATHVRAKAWWADASEPGTWQVNSADTSYTASGAYGFGFQGYGGLTKLRVVSYADGSDDALVHYPGGGRVMSGKLFRPDNVAESNTLFIVRAIDRDTGLVVASDAIATNGDFSVTVDSNAQHQVFCLDQVCHAWKPPIADRITPGAP